MWSHISVLFFSLDDLKIAIFPSPEVMATAGDMVAISCTLDCICEGNIVLNWTLFGTRGLPPSAVITRSDSMRTVTLQFPAASVDVSGIYVCTAVRGDTDVTTENARLVVQ